MKYIAVVLIAVCILGKLWLLVRFLKHKDWESAALEIITGSIWVWCFVRILMLE